MLRIVAVRSALPSVLFMLFCAGTIFTKKTVAQNLTNLPTGELLPPDFEFAHVRYYPALSVNGFDCTDAGKTCDYGLGFKQIIEAAEAPITNPQTARFFNALVELASRPLTFPDTRKAIRQNAFIAEARAFVANATILIEANGGAPEAVNLPSHDDAMANLEEIAQDLSYIIIDPALSDDAVKWTAVLSATARMTDFYLALEQAYLHYGKSDDLFSCSVKSDLLTHLQNQAHIVDDLGNTSIVDLKFIKIFGIDITSIFREIHYDEVQGGNWPMKVHVSAGYATLVPQYPTSPNCNTFEPTEKYDHWLNRAFESTAGTDPEARNNHWAYQTNNGHQFWAEGPFYFNFALSTVLPFWHAVRAQGLLPESNNFNESDPFFTAWFLEPLKGFADAVTPDGATPPLEDGNKIPTSTAYLMQWDGQYGDMETGSKFHWIAEAQTTLPPEDHWSLAMSLPVATKAISPATQITPAPNTAHPQQIILRRDGQTGSCASLPRNRTRPCHYILLNGETRAAIRPGEGHEQSDQLQLLYYVDDTSFLADAGYDSAPGIENSTWNGYRHHNVMTADRLGMEGGHGGLPEPEAGLLCKRKVETRLGDIFIPEACMYADHNETSALGHYQNGRIDVIEASVLIHPDAGSGSEAVHYERTVFFIDDSESPYLIDVNAARSTEPATSSPTVLTMQYHGHAEEATFENGGATAYWSNIWKAPDSLGVEPAKGISTLSIDAFSVETDLQPTLTAAIGREPSIEGLSAGEGIGTQKLALSNRPLLSDQDGSTSIHTTAAFIQANASSTAPITQTNFTEIFPRPWQAFVRYLDAFTVDVVVVRSAGSDLETELSISLDISDESKWTVDQNFISAGISFDDQSNGVTLMPEVRAGFVRLKTAGNVSTPSEEKFALALHPPTPNPFRSRTNLSFELPTPGHVQLDIFDVLGRHVETVYEGHQSPGLHTLTWHSRRLPAGVYFCRLVAGDKVRTIRMSLLQR